MGVVPPTISHHNVELLDARDAVSCPHVEAWLRRLLDGVVAEHRAELLAAADKDDAHQAALGHRLRAEFDRRAAAAVEAMRERIFDAVMESPGVVNPSTNTTH